MRGRAHFLKVGDQMGGTQVARVLKSRCAEFPEGSQVVGNFGWRDLTVYKPEPNGPRTYSTIHKMPEMKGLPDSYALGSVGMPGNTAYFGFLEICQPKSGETVVVSAAGGAVGSLVGQIAKIKGCKVLAFAGNPDKLKWLKEELKFDHVFDYKKVDLDKTFTQFAPQGIDCYFDNVAGDFNYHVVRHMNEYGRISQCGSISAYNKEQAPGEIPMVPFDYITFRIKHVKMEGFNVGRWTNRWFEGLHQIRDWILEGKIQVRETVTEGFEKMPEAFIEMLQGNNFGKQVVKA